MNRKERHDMEITSVIYPKGRKDESLKGSEWYMIGVKKKTLCGNVVEMIGKEKKNNKEIKKRGCANEQMKLRVLCSKTLNQTASPCKPFKL